MLNFFALDDDGDSMKLLLVFVTFAGATEKATPLTLLTIQLRARKKSNRLTVNIHALEAAHRGLAQSIRAKYVIFGPRRALSWGGGRRRIREKWFSNLS